MLLAIALRNLWRHKRRSAITGAAIALGLALLMFSSGGTDGITNNMIEKGTGAVAGHVVVQGAGWQEARESEIVVPDSPAVARTLGEALPEATIVRRVFFEGLLTSPAGASGVAVTAVQPGPESEVDDLDDKVVEGTYLVDEAGGAPGIVLGRTLAETLDVGIGDKVVLMAQGSGEIESRLFRVQGIFSMGIEAFDALVVHVPLEAGQELLGLGQDVTQVSAHLPSARDTDAATARVRAAVAGPGLEVLSWPEALPDLAGYVATEQGEIYVVYAVLFFMVALGILNTLLMSVLERMREFGVMRAIGLLPGQLARLVLLEAALLGAFSVVVGVVLGSLVLWPLAVHGIDLTALTGGTIEAAGFALDFVIYPDPDPVKVAVYAVAIWGLTVLSAIYPAWKAATLRPVDCLAHH